MLRFSKVVVSFAFPYRRFSNNHVATGPLVAPTMYGSCRSCPSWVSAGLHPNTTNEKNQLKQTQSKTDRQLFNWVQPHFLNLSICCNVGSFMGMLPNQESPTCPAAPTTTASHVDEPALRQQDVSSWTATGRVMLISDTKWLHATTWQIWRKERLNITQSCKIWGLGFVWERWMPSDYIMSNVYFFVWITVSPLLQTGARVLFNIRWNRKNRFNMI